MRTISVHASTSASIIRKMPLGVCVILTPSPPPSLSLSTYIAFSFLFSDLTSSNVFPAVELDISFFLIESLACVGIVETQSQKLVSVDWDASAKFSARFIPENSDETM